MMCKDHFKVQKGRRDGNNKGKLKYTVDNVGQRKQDNKNRKLKEVIESNTTK